MNQNWSYRLDDSGMGWLCLDCREQRINLLSVAVLHELEELLDSLEAETPKGLVLYSGKPEGFIAGADAGEFLRIESTPRAEAHIRWVHGLFARVQALPYPTLAQIHGFCLGGGLELALCMDYRIATDDAATRIGFPEVRLGIFPGYGGSARAIARMGALDALRLMLSGRALSGKQAQRQGLVDWLVPMRQLHAGSLALLAQRPAPRRPRPLQRLANIGIARALLAPRIQRQANLHADPTHYPAATALIGHWRRHGADPQALYESEAREVARLIQTDTARNLIRVFQLQERLKGLGREHAFEANRVHVVGGGIMGGDIAAWCALRGLRVTLQDTAPQRLTRAMARAHDLFQRRLRDPRLTAAAWDRLQPDHKGHGIARADVIIEAIFEDLEAKRALFQALERRASAQALLASNTSSIPLEEIASALHRPRRLIGLHFFNPVAQMQLVEVVRGRDSDPQCLGQGLAFVRTIERLPLPVKSAPGFLVNRVLMPYLLEALELLGEGVPASAVDQAAKAFGMPIGPVELADAVGLDICLAVARGLAGHTATPAEVPRALQRRVDANLLGKKSGQGFYHWTHGHALLPKIPADYRAPDDLKERLIFRLLNEAVACLREGIVSDADLLDAGVIFGTGFAPFRGGPMHYIRSGGLERMRHKLQQLQAAHGEHFIPDRGWQGLGHA